jgi:hypothetical protein
MMEPRPENDRIWKSVIVLWPLSDIAEGADHELARENKARRRTVRAQSAVGAGGLLPRRRERQNFFKLQSTSCDTNFEQTEAGFNLP